MRNCENVVSQPLTEKKKLFIILICNLILLYYCDKIGYTYSFSKYKKLKSTVSVFSHIFFPP